MHAEHDGEHGWPEAVPEAEAELVIVVPVALQPVKVEKQLVEQDWLVALAGTEHRIEQSDTVVDAHSDDDGDDVGADVGVWEDVGVLCDCDFFSSSSGSSGFSLLPGVSGSLGSVPEPPPPTSPPPPGGQKGHIHVGPCIPNPPVPPFHQLPPGPTIMTAAEMVNLLPSLLVSTLKRNQWCFYAIEVIYGLTLG